jgi:hypothetical protein
MGTIYFDIYFVADDGVIDYEVSTIRQRSISYAYQSDIVFFGVIKEIYSGKFFMMQLGINYGHSKTSNSRLFNIYTTKCPCYRASL